MSLENAVALVLAVAVLAYLVYALLAPEKLG
jgi:K+-transporting ATPase KdpF subunit